MSGDIDTDELRALGDGIFLGEIPGPAAQQMRLLHSAADEIDRLRAALSASPAGERDEAALLAVSDLLSKACELLGDVPWSGSERYRRWRITANNLVTEAEALFAAPLAAGERDITEAGDGTVWILDPQTLEEVRFTVRQAAGVILAMQAENADDDDIDPRTGYPAMMPLTEWLSFAFDGEGYGEHVEAYSRPHRDEPHALVPNGEVGYCEVCGDGENPLHLAARPAPVTGKGATDERLCVAEGHWTQVFAEDGVEVIHDPDEGPCEFGPPAPALDPLRDENLRLKAALEACVANIEETGEWGIDALTKTRAALVGQGEEPTSPPAAQRLSGCPECSERSPQDVPWYCARCDGTGYVVTYRSAPAAPEPDETNR